MAANSSMSLTSLDPKTLNDAFIAYAKADKVFKDWAFDGANLQAVLRILNYNT